MIKYKYDYTNVVSAIILHRGYFFFHWIRMKKKKEVGDL